MKKLVVISLGGSLIVPGKIDWRFLDRFRKVLLQNTNHYKFIVVCGGGSVARTYIHGLDNERIIKKRHFQSLLGISVTRINARFLSYFFGRDANQGVPHDMKDVEHLLKK